MTSCIIGNPFAILRSSILFDSFLIKGNGSYTSLSDVMTSIILNPLLTKYELNCQSFSKRPRLTISCVLKSSKKCRKNAHFRKE